MITTSSGGGLSVTTLALAKKFSKGYTDSAISGISGGINYKGAVNYYSDLPANPTENDAYTVKYKGSSGTDPDGTEYVWALYDGNLQWIAFGPDISQFSKVTANPTVPSGTVPTALSNIEIDSNYYSIYKAVTATLISTNWSSNTQTVTVNGVTSANNVIVAPAPASISDYASSGIYCSAQGANSLTFTCDTAPVNNITVNVLIVG